MYISEDNQMIPNDSVGLAGEKRIEEDEKIILRMTRVSKEKLDSLVADCTQH